MDVTGYAVRPSRHFILTWMRKWNFDIPMVKTALENAHKVNKVGKEKYEAFCFMKNTSIKIIFIKNEDLKEILVITGAEGK